MSQAVVLQVLSMGIDASRVKIAIKRRLEAAGSGFESAEELINAAFSVQREQEERTLVENSQSNSAFLRSAGESPANQVSTYAAQISPSFTSFLQESYDEVTERTSEPEPSSGLVRRQQIIQTSPAAAQRGKNREI